MAKVDISGAIDMHCHFGPDPRRPRSVDALQVAREAQAAGLRGVVLKSHDYPTPAIAALAQEAVGGPTLFGSICCDEQVGGINPAAVEAALRIGAKVVWMPTHSSKVVDPGSAKLADAGSVTHAHSAHEAGTIRLLDDDGELLPATLDVLALAEEHGAIVATGHTARDEHFAVTREFVSRGTVVITHARQASCQPDLSVDDCVALADLGAVIEFSAITCLGVYACRTVDEIVGSIKAVGVDRCVASTDFGQEKNPHPAEGMQLMADAFLAAGLEEKEVRQMMCDSPARILEVG
jgi:Family of unknown function (DUF6282)